MSKHVPSDPQVNLSLSDSLLKILSKTSARFPRDRQQLLDMALGDDKDCDLYEVAYDIPELGRVVEATVARCKNGLAVNYTEPYMRRRDPDAMVIADEGETDKPRFSDRFDIEFQTLRQETFDWLAAQEQLIVLPFKSGDAVRGINSLLVAPANAGFFVASLADLQGFLSPTSIKKGFKPEAVIYLAPPFRHTHFQGRQVVVHNRLFGMHELFSYNLYPGPSAKKGVYGILLTKGEAEGWLTLHCSTARLTTPYDNEFVILHEGSSGSGKSEMIQEVHRESDGRILLGENILTKEQLHIDLVDTCKLEAVTDDMALAPLYLQRRNRKLVVEDAESGWFMRVDHLNKYGTDPFLERLCINPPEPLMFLNIDGQPKSTCLLWEHILDEPDKPCPNPRVIIPRRYFDNILSEPVEIDVRSFGVRTPPCTREHPSYGIIGMLHILPPPLAWLWRLVAPRGHSNPSIVASAGLSSEGVGSYWPFATGKMVRHANLLLEMARRTPRTRFVLIPNQHIGAYRVGFKAEWIAREYMARRGSVIYRPEQLTPARCPLLGYPAPSLRVNGQEMPPGLLRVDKQLAVGTEGYDKGTKILVKFFQKELKKFYTSDLHPKGRAIINICMDNGSVEDYERLFAG